MAHKSVSSARRALCGRTRTSVYHRCGWGDGARLAGDSNVRERVEPNERGAGAKSEMVRGGAGRRAEWSGPLESEEKARRRA